MRAHAERCGGEQSALLASGEPCCLFLVNGEAGMHMQALRQLYMF